MKYKYQIKNRIYQDRVRYIRKDSFHHSGLSGVTKYLTNHLNQLPHLNLDANCYRYLKEGNKSTQTTSTKLDCDALPWIKRIFSYSINVFFIILLIFLKTPFFSNHTGNISLNICTYGRI